MDHKVKAMRLVGAKGIVALLLILLAFSRTIEGLWQAWQTDEYSHGILIPFIAAFLSWHRLVEVKPPLRASWLGVLALVGAGFFLLVGRLAAFAMIEQYALVLAVVGLCLTFLGRAASLAMAPALFYLVFAIPLPNMVQASLSQDLQLLSSTLGVWPLQALGFSVFQEGNVIDLGGYSLQVVDACSGLRYIFPLMSFGYLIAFLYRGALWKRGVLFLSTVPIAIFMNALRISVIGVTVNWWGIEMAQGIVHEFEGWVVFLACTLLLMLEVLLLKFIGKVGRLNWDYVAFPHGRITNDSTAKLLPQIMALLVVALLATVMMTGIVENRKEKIQPHISLATFPLVLGEWQGRAESLDPVIATELKLSDYWIADYGRGREEPGVNFYIAYYDSQRAGVITHTPASCIPGGGWRIENKSVKRVEALKVSRILARRGKEAILVYYWFDQRGRNLTESYEVKAYLLADSLRYGRTDGTLMRIVTPVGDQETVETAERRLQDFTILVRGTALTYLPPSLF